ncbi:MAG: acylphosphatase, partial [Bacteroidota bacterium]
YTEMFAIQNDICGYIENGSVSQVYIEAEGDKQKLDELENYLAGSPLSRHVDSLDSQAGELKDFKRFKVLHDKKTRKKTSFLKKTTGFLNNLIS